MPRGGRGGIGSTEVEFLLRGVQRALVATNTDNNGYMILKYIGILSWIPIISSYESKELLLPAPLILVLIMSNMMTIIIVIMMLIFMILLCNDYTSNTYLSPPPPRFLRSKGELSRVLRS